MNNNDVIKLLDNEKTIAEHEKIILRYFQTGILDRADAIRKYKEFNIKHPEYCAAIESCRISGGNVFPLENMPDGDIVVNLNRQLMHLGGKNLLEDLKND